MSIRLIEKVQRNPSVHIAEHSKNHTEHNFRHERINLSVKCTAIESAVRLNESNILTVSYWRFSRIFLDSQRQSQFKDITVPTEKANPNQGFKQY